MPYDFTFKRVDILDNKTALEKNISLAIELTDIFPEIYDANSSDSAFHFTKTKLVTNKEFPEQHFYLEAGIDGFFYIFSFWKDDLYVELGANGNPVERFKYLRNYSEIILKHGFQIEEPLGETLLSSEIGFKRHIEEYNKWAGFVGIVKRLNE